MKLRLWKFVVCSFGIVGLTLSGGCYKRTTAPTYQPEDAEVIKIREQLGAVTPDKEYKNLAEEDE